jgi:DNA modification methylase
MGIIYNGDSLEILKTLPSESVHCIITSPPYYGLRDYGEESQIGLEDTPDKYIEKLVIVFREVWRVLRNDGTLWLNIADSYAGGGGYCPNSPSNLNNSKQSTRGGDIKGRIKPSDGIKAKDLIGIPWMLAFALRADGWYLRQDCIWNKPIVCQNQ